MVFDTDVFIGCGETGGVVEWGDFIPGEVELISPIDKGSGRKTKEELSFDSTRCISPCAPSFVSSNSFRSPSAVQNIKEHY